ncbi:hypothetical protein FOA52_006273 [Chlamydomonas sp. UWO 241]|nr:hypothetical protein FOA52_006273 [Chlamydomonas sp. UWO 241]
MDCILTPALDAGYVANPVELYSAGTTAYDKYVAAYALKLDSTEWVGNASEIVCSCVDMAKASTWGEGELASWYISSCPDCTAMQKSCYKRRNITWSEIPNHMTVDGFVDEDPRVPFIKVVNAVLPNSYALWTCDDAPAGDEKAYLVSVLNVSTCATLNGTSVSVFEGDIVCGGDGSFECSIAFPSGEFPGYMLAHLDETIQVNNTGASCVGCMRTFLGGANEEFAYACEQYCMNTYTISNLLEHNQCNDCIKAGAELDKVSPCEMCIQSVSGNVFPDATDRLARRGRCMTCINDASDMVDANKDWACGECAKLRSDAAYTQCFTCISEGDLDPCACVDGVKRGWLFFEAAAGGCFDQEAIDTELEDGELEGKGTKTETGNVTADQCAQIADGLGRPTFGLDKEGYCYTFTANIPYISGLNVTSGCAAGDENCLCSFTPVTTTPIANTPAPGPITLAGLTVGQSSNSSGRSASRATDENNCTNAYDSGGTCSGGCTHTSQAGNPTTDSNPFWWVDLGADYVVTSIVILGRKEYESRLDKLTIFVGSINPETFTKPSTSVITSSPTTALLVTDLGDWTVSEERTYDATYNDFNEGNSGTYVTIQGSVEALTLCDVKIFGYAVPV